MSELEEYVKIGTDTDGNAVVEVLTDTSGWQSDSYHSVEIYKGVIKHLKKEGFSVANNKQNSVKVSNENTKFQKTVTVSGKGESVSKQWMEEMAK